MYKNIIEQGYRPIGTVDRKNPPKGRWGESSEFKEFDKKTYAKDYYKRNKEKIKAATKKAYNRNKLKREKLERENEIFRKFTGGS
jgi:hypothetical protein